MWAMFPISCARVCAHTGRETSAHKKTRSTQQNSLQKSFLHIFYAHHPTHRRVLVNVAQKKFYAHTEFRKLEGTLHVGPYSWNHLSLELQAELLCLPLSSVFGSKESTAIRMVIPISGWLKNCNPLI